MLCDEVSTLDWVVSLQQLSLIGTLVHILDKESIWFNDWGFIRNWDGDGFHISGETINEELYPVFDRTQFRIPRKLR